ncbi:DUF488 family protein [Thiothrix eikelboomii]|uniref:DUF488 domain-containing protein n=1 Tax=Thiothrix eikelboomii TaxID=92487 RepID=UPI003BAE416A
MGYTEKIVDTRVFTVGYEGMGLDEFVQCLQLAGVHLLVDVREVPLSRKPGFSKKGLSAYLQSKGIDYLHIQALGCPKSIRNQYKFDHDWMRYTRDFLAYLRQEQAKELEKLTGIASQTPSALMCFEANAAQCHRSLITYLMAQAQPIAIEHLVRLPKIKKAA